MTMELLFDLAMWSLFPVLLIGCLLIRKAEDKWREKAKKQSRNLRIAGYVILALNITYFIGINATASIISGVIIFVAIAIPIATFFGVLLWFIAYDDWICGKFDKQEVTPYGCKNQNT